MMTLLWLRPEPCRVELPDYRRKQMAGTVKTVPALFLNL